MRKIIVYNRVSLDGFFTGANGEIDWFIHDVQVDRAAHRLMQPDTILLGRKTYQMFAGYWPNVEQNPASSEHDLALAHELSAMTKIVFSSTLQEVSWMNTRLAAGDLIKEVLELKEKTGDDITIFGSGSIVQQLITENLVDEFILIITPILLGKGKSMFQNNLSTRLKLIEIHQFESGNILSHYAV